MRAVGPQVLVVDAQEGVGITTDEAVGCAEDLGVKHVIVALNKADLVDSSRLKEVEVMQCTGTKSFSIFSFTYYTCVAELSIPPPNLIRFFFSNKFLPWDTCVHIRNILNTKSFHNHIPCPITFDSLLKASLRDFVLLEKCPMVPISALHRMGLDALADALSRTFNECAGAANMIPSELPAANPVKSATAKEDKTNTAVTCQALVFDLTTLKGEVTCNSNSLVPICGCSKGRKHVHFLKCSVKFSTTSKFDPPLTSFLHCRAQPSMCWCRRVL